MRLLDWAVWKLPNLAAILISCFMLSLSTVVNAAPQPMTLSPIFTDALPSTVKVSKNSPPCVVRFTELIDARHAPETLGVVGRRAIYAPKDRAGWMISIMNGLKSRGISPVLEQGAAFGSGAIDVKVSLQTLWVTNGLGGITTTAVMKVQTIGKTSETADQFYRGNMLKTAYWSGGPSVVQASIDGALSKVLDSIATDFQHICAS
jgi:hypothetical protein